MGRIKADWSLIRHEYVTNPLPLSYTALAKKHGLRRETVTIRGEKEQWPLERERFISRVDEQKTEIKATTLASEGAEFDKTCFTLAKWLVVEAVKDRKSGDASLREASAIISTAQAIAKTALGDKQTLTQELQIQGETSIDDLLKQYGPALGISQSEDNTGNNPAEPLHSAQDPQSEAIPVPIPDK